MAAPTTEVMVSKQFNDSNADITYRSSDGVVFHIHSSQLTHTTGCLLPTEFKPDGRIVDLTEDSSTLELMFCFLCPQPQPNLESIPFDDLSQLAEAVEKYQVYPAMQVCNIFMARFIPDHPTKVLDYSVKHGYPDLSNKAAPLITLESMSALSKSLSPETVLPWVQYFHMWDAHKRDAITFCRQKTPVSHHCTRWVSYERDIWATLAKADRPQDKVFSLITLEQARDAPTCCISEATKWHNLVEAQYQSRPLRLFTDFL